MPTPSATMSTPRPTLPCDCALSDVVARLEVVKVRLAALTQSKLPTPAVRKD